MKMNKRYLHIGCGNNILPKPFENLDVRGIEGVDHISEAFPLTQFKDETFDLVYASHLLEHYPRNKVELVVKEWTRILKVDGMLRLSVPSFENIVKIYQETGKLENVIGPVVGGQTYDYEFHYCIFDKRTLTDLMKRCGLTAVHNWIYQRTTHADYWDFSQAETYDIQVSLNLEGRKKINNFNVDEIDNSLETKKDKLHQ